MRRPGARLCPLLAVSWLMGGVCVDAALAAPAGTLDRLVDQLDHKLDRALERRDLAHTDLALALRGDQAVAPELVRVVRRLVAGRLGRRGLRSYRVFGAPAGRQATLRQARAGGFELLLDGDLSIVEGWLHLRAELHATDRSLWRDTVGQPRGSLSHLHASVRVDAELRAYQGQGGRVRAAFSQRSVPLGRQRVLALATADLTRDGRDELVALFATSVVVLRYRAQPPGYQQLATMALKQPRAALAPRRTLGTLVIGRDATGRALILARSSLLSRAVELRYDAGRLQLVRSLPGYPLAADAGPEGSLLVGALDGARDWFNAPSPTAGVDGKQAPLTLPATFYALRARVIATASGRRRFVATVDTAGRLGLLEDRRPAGEIAGVGVAFDLADVDDDGTLEVIASEPSDPDAPDRIDVYRLTGGSLKRVWRSAELPGPVLALTHGDLDRDGKRELIGAVAGPAGQISLVMVK